LPPPSRIERKEGKPVSLIRGQRENPNP